MNYILKKFKNNYKKVLLNLTVVVAFFLISGIVFYSTKSSSQALPDCSTLANGVTADPGNNCLYFNLPICTSTQTAKATIINPQHRTNCADLIDLPLCGDIDNTSNILPNKNCVSECSSIPDDVTKIRGIDYAVHNKHCIRFCDNIENNVSSSLSNSAKCVTRNCHQNSYLSSGALVVGSNNGYVKDANGNPNCNLLPCNKLTVDELSDTKFADETKKYCEGDNVKCYEFSQSKIVYAISRNSNTMCRLHYCPPPNQGSGCLNEVSTINALGDSFKSTYARYIVGIDPSKENIDQALSTICLPYTCKPFVLRQYICNPIDSDNPTILNSQCDSNSTCIDGYCTKAIDCNLSSNSTEPECITTTSSSEEESESDSYNSWFYRPKPSSKSTFSNGLLYTMDDNLCYSNNQLKSTSEHNWGREIKIKLFLGLTVNLGYFHSDHIPDETRSPGLCELKKNFGFRGYGYTSLCGNQGNLFKKVSDETAYHKGTISTQFTETDSVSKLKVCLRFQNALRYSSNFTGLNTVENAAGYNTETCGRRQCAIVCNFGICLYQTCGYDICQELTVRGSNAQNCMFNEDLFSRDTNLFDSFEAIGEGSCSKIIDGFLRVRAVQYGNRICTFLDSKGQPAYNKMFFDGSEKLSDGTCYSGSRNEMGNCVGSKNSNDSKSSAEKWRTILKIPYIQNNRPNITDPNLRGYINKEGKLIKEQECMKVPLRISPPRLYNVGTFDNSKKLFSPPLYILNANTQRGGITSPPTDTQILGITDFNYPELVLKYGNTTKTLSLGIGKTGYETETNMIDPASKATVTTDFRGNSLSTNVFVRKEYDSNNSVPTFCLYQTITNSQGLTNDILIGCVRRNFPEINNSSSLVTATNTRKVLVSNVASNTYDNASISVQYQGKNTEVSDSFTLNNPSQSNPNCQTTVERYKICAQREECNQLNNECILNEIAIQNSSTGSDISSFLSTRNNCFNILQPKCFLKKGMKKDASGNYTQSISNTYGWFDEICISSGFETKLKKVVAYKTTEGSNLIDSVKGKCIIDTSKSRAGVDCSAGGKAPDCVCLEAVDGITISTNQVVRLATPREAGLCVDLPLPQSCAAITYSDATARTNATNYGHAEFPLSIFGMNNVEGQCNGNWKKAVVTGVESSPKMSCVRNPNNTASWSNIVTNSCVRYTCPQIYTNDPTVNSSQSVAIVYSNSYSAADGTNETDKGSSNGYALWPSTTSNDSSQTISATGCITGFRINGASLPTRQCNSIGQWQTVTNSCVRKTCAATNFINSSAIGSDAWNSSWSTSSYNPNRYSVGSQSWYNVWQAWGESGGASFAITNASRNATTIQYESIATGVCNTELGYYSGGVAPTRSCDSNGNWGPVQNPCVTSCNAITSSTTPAPTINDGFAYWNQAQVAINSTEIEVTATSCRSGYQRYPYSPPKNSRGENINVDANGFYLEGNSQDPKRLCKSSIANGITSAAHWEAAYPSCVNKCPGATIDSRIGVGRTQHKLSNGSTITLNWNDANPGETQVLASPISLTDHNASNYDSNRNNGFYIVSRTCGSNLRWETYTVNGTKETVKPLCSGKSGSLNNTNATFSSTSDTINEGETITGSCNASYGTRTTNPVYKCQQKDNNRYIDQFYYAQSGGGTCIRVCSIPSVGTNTIPQFGSNGSYYAGGESGNKYVGDTITLSCISDYGKAIDNDSGTSDDSCGRIAIDRTNISPTAACGLDGNWSIVNNGKDCSACRTCSNSSGIYGSISTNYSATNSCNINSWTLQELWPYCDNLDFVATHNSTIVFGVTRQRNCKKAGVCTNKERNVCLAFTTKCIDGLFLLTGDGYNAGIGDEDKDCGTSIKTCRSYSVADNC